MPSRLSLFARAGVFDKTSEVQVSGLAACIGAGGRVLRNHYHVLVDALPRLQWLGQLPSQYIDGLELCVSHQLGRYEDLVRELLPPGVKLRYVADDCWISADRYLFLPQVSMSSCGALPTGYSDKLVRFASRIDRCESRTRRQRRILISRQQAAMRRIRNFDQILPVLHEHGVEVVALENLSVAGQAALFHSAEVVIASHGAGLANLLFAPSTIAVELSAAEPKTHYRCLSAAIGHDYRNICVHDGHKNDDFELLPSLLLDILASLDGPQHSQSGKGARA